MNSAGIHDALTRSFIKLRTYCEAENFRGWDPYDGLNSFLFRRSPLSRIKAFRLMGIQLFKRNPVNLRNIFLIKKDYNPKGLSLFLAGYCNLYKAQPEQKYYLDNIRFLSERLVELKLAGYSGACWGYNFDWQSRSFFIPKFTPNIIVSTFAGNAFLDVYEVIKDDSYLEISRSICDFIMKDLNRTYDNNSFCFTYSPLDNSRIFNASLLASKFLARLYYLTGDSILKEEAKKSVEFCIRHQNGDGSWFYGLDSNQRWIDSFHTGYNLEALYEYQRFTQDESYGSHLNKGLRYYLDNFFTSEGIPKFYPDSIYPIDIHSAAELIAFMAKTVFFNEHLNLVNSVLNWCMRNMQDRKGYFYYQIKKHYRIKIPYMRWSCAWMFYALSCYIRRISIDSETGSL